MSRRHHSLYLSAFAILFFLFGSLIGCAGPGVEQASCEQADWYEIGRRDGAQGTTPDQLVKHRKACGKNFRSDWETMYTNGRNAGMVEYCEPKNAYELGRMGIVYYYVCPSTVEPQFITSYRRGQHAHDLESEGKKIDLEIDRLAQKLLTANDRFDQQEISTQLSELKKSRAQKDRELNKIISN